MFSEDCDLTSNLITTLIVAVAWIAFIQRGYVAWKRRQSSPSGSSKIPLKLIWIPCFFLLLAGTTYNEPYLHFISSHFGDWFIYVPRQAFGVISFITSTYTIICYRLLPHSHLPRWREWTVVAGLLAIIDFTLLKWIGWYLFQSRFSNFETLAEMVFGSYLLVATIRVGLPMAHWCRAREPGIIFRMRLNFLWWFNLFFAVWKATELLTSGIGNTMLTLPFVVGFGIAFILVFLTPDNIYERHLIHLYHLSTFLSIRLVELLIYLGTAGTISRSLSQVTWHEVIKFPDRATYKSIISILDSSKILNALSEETLAGSIGRKISHASNVHFGYLEVVNYLREIGWQYLLDKRTVSAVFRMIGLRTQGLFQSHQQTTVEASES